MSARETKSKGKAPRWGIWAAIVGLAVVLGGVGLVYLLGMPDKDDAGETPPSSEQPIAPSSEPSTDGCDAKGGNITDVPADLDWAAAAGASWPISPSLGPTSTEDGWPVCFSHSPVGAALAATAIPFATADRAPQDVSEFYIVDSPGKATAVADAADTATLPEQLEQYGMQLVGFRVDEYTEERALVRIVFSSPNSQTGYTGLPYPMVWVDGDWRLKVLDDGSTGQAVPMNDGQFTRWTNNG